MKQYYWTQEEITLLHKLREFPIKMQMKLLDKSYQSISLMRLKQKIFKFKIGCLTRDRICPSCGIVFFGKNKTCSRNCFKTLLSEHHQTIKNKMWKGNDVGYVAIHDWVRKRKPKHSLCMRCNQRPAYDLANISGQYKRDVNDFEWLCRKCHSTEDGRLKKLHSRDYSFVSEKTREKMSIAQKKRKRIKTNRIITCSKCGRKEKHDARGMCHRCYSLFKYYKNKQR